MNRNSILKTKNQDVLVKSLKLRYIKSIVVCGKMEEREGAIIGTGNERVMQVKGI